MHTPTRLISFVLLGSALVLFAACSADSSPESVQTSTGSTTAPAPVTDPLFGVGELHADWSTGHGTGSGIASPIGEWTYEVDGTFFGSTKATGTATTKSGDQLFLDITTELIPGGPLPPHARNRSSVVITGGTGQYANAAGGWKGEVQEQKVEGSLVDATLWFRGTITHYPS